MSNLLIQSEARRLFRKVAKRTIASTEHLGILEKSMSQFHKVPHGFQAYKMVSCHVMYLVFSISSEFLQFMHLSQSFK